VISTVAKGAAAVALVGLLASLFVIPFLINARAPGANPTAIRAGAQAAAASVQPTSSAPEAQVRGVGTPVVAGKDCTGTASADDRLEPTTENALTVSSGAVTGTVATVEGPFWNTPDGSAAPADALSPFSVYRTVTISVDKAMKGDIGSKFTFRVPGGKVGCAVFAPEGIPLEIAKGDAYLFFTQDLPATDAKGGAVPTVTDMWPVSSGVVATPVDGKVSIQEVATEAASVK
jgi:hypothetical protein